MAAGHLGERFRRQLVRSRDRNTNRRQCPKGGCSRSVFERGPLAEDCPRTYFGDRLAVDLNRQDPIEQQEQLVAFLTLLDESLVLRQLAKFRLGAAAHDLLGQLAFELALDLRDKAGESSLPQGVLAPKMSADQLEKSVVATLCESLPEPS